MGQKTAGNREHGVRNRKTALLETENRSPYRGLQVDMATNSPTINQTRDHINDHPRVPEEDGFLNNECTVINNGRIFLFIHQISSFSTNLWLSQRGRGEVPENGFEIEKYKKVVF